MKAKTMGQLQKIGVFTNYEILIGSEYISAHILGLNPNLLFNQNLVISLA